MQNGQKTIMSTRQPRPAASFAARSKRWTSNATRPEPKSSQNAQRNYERYLALAQAEAQVGNSIGAENYYQHAEHYFRSMSSDLRSNVIAFAATVPCGQGEASMKKGEHVASCNVWSMQWADVHNQLGRMVSFPRITSARSDDAIRTKQVW